MISRTPTTSSMNDPINPMYDYSDELRIEPRRRIERRGMTECMRKPVEN